MNEGAVLRDAGIQQVMAHNEDWAGEVTRAFHWWINRIDPHDTFALEDFRACVEELGMPQPHHVNAWGGLAKRFAHLIEPVGYAQSSRPSSHARITRLYRKK